MRMRQFAHAAAAGLWGLTALACGPAVHSTSAVVPVREGARDQVETLTVRTLADRGFREWDEATCGQPYWRCFRRQDEGHRDEITVRIDRVTEPDERAAGLDVATRSFEVRVRARSYYAVRATTTDGVPGRGISWANAPVSDAVKADVAALLAALEGARGTP